MAWDPAQYLKFAGPRLRPALDLLQRIDRDAPTTVYDVGAGAGNVTRLIADRWPAAHIVGVDSSTEMLTKAAAENPKIQWQKADFGTWRPDRPADVIYSNAALHWLDDHDTLFPGLLTGLAPRGVLAVQIPRNFGARSHTLITETALDGPWRATLEPLLRPAPVAEPAFYYDLLAPRVAALDMWETEYLQVLDGVNPVKEWTKGTWLSPLLSALNEPDRSDFEAAYAERVLAVYPPRSDGKTLFPFRRLFMIATAA
ncbi:MAG TPA: methyltransferase domain-containing protein [Stellaceae bacterium]|jgi:trans-aconitate 2-methyltransferase|nr:methyltransferase domain-containing protein [Stellaceae bacterium]